MEIVARVYSGYKETYKKIYKDVVISAYKRNGLTIDSNNISYQVISLDGNTVQSQRSKKKVQEQ